MSEHVGIKVVIHNGVVFVGSANHVYAEFVSLSGNKRAPVRHAPRYFEQNFGALVEQKFFIARSFVVAVYRVKNVVVYVVLRCNGFENMPAFLAVNRVPTEKRAHVVHLLSPFARLIQNIAAIRYELFRNFGVGVYIHRHHKHFGVPKRVPAVSRARKPVCRNVGYAVFARRLKNLQRRKTQTLLHGFVGIDLNIRVFPKLPELFGARRKFGGKSALCRTRRVFFSFFRIFFAVAVCNIRNAAHKFGAFARFQRKRINIL